MAPCHQLLAYCVIQQVRAVRRCLKHIGHLNRLCVPIKEAEVCEPLVETSGSGRIIQIAGVQRYVVVPWTWPNELIVKHPIICG